MAEVTYYNNINDGFFNAVNSDRIYNADDLCEWLSSTNSDGVVPAPTGQLQVLASNSGNIVNVSIGIGLIKGHVLNLKVIEEIQVENAPSTTGYFRLDLIGMRINYSARRCELFYRSGTVNSSTKPALLDNESYYEIALAYITVNGGASTNVIQSNIEDARVFVFSTSTFFQELKQQALATTTTTSLPISVQYNERLDIINVYVNGLQLVKGTNYNISNNVILFSSGITTGSRIDVSVWHFTNAAGLEQLDLSNTETVVQEINKYYYYCNGVDDNVKLSDIAQNFLAGTGDYTGINAYAQMELIICGDVGVSGNYSGNGTSAYPYTYFAFGRGQESSRTIYFNFSNASRITVNAPTTANTYATIFSGADINIRNVSLNVASGYNVDIFDGTKLHCQDSEFWMSTTNDCCVGRCCGFFENIRTSITSLNGNAFCFYGNGNLLRVIGGNHYAWTASSSKEAVCFYVEAYQTANVLFLQMVNCPQYARSGYYQTDTIKVNHGYATIMMNTIWKAATLYNTTNCIAYGNVIISKN